MRQQVAGFSETHPVCSVGRSFVSVDRCESFHTPRGRADIWSLVVEQGKRSNLAGWLMNPPLKIHNSTPQRRLASPIQGAGWIPKTFPKKSITPPKQIRPDSFSWAGYCDSRRFDEWLRRWGSTGKPILRLICNRKAIRKLLFLGWLLDGVVGSQSSLCSSSFVWKSLCSHFLSSSKMIN